MTSCAGLLRLFVAAGACSQEVTFMVHDDTAVGLDGLQVEFDDERVVSDAGIVWVATLAQRLGLEALAQRRGGPRGGRAGAARAGGEAEGRRFALVGGGDSSAAGGALRAGRQRRAAG